MHALNMEGYTSSEEGSRARSSSIRLSSPHRGNRPQIVFTKSSLAPPFIVQTRFVRKATGAISITCGWQRELPRKTNSAKLLSVPLIVLVHHPRCRTALSSSGTIEVDEERCRGGTRGRTLLIMTHYRISKLVSYPFCGWFLYRPWPKMWTSADFWAVKRQYLTINKYITNAFFPVASLEDSKLRRDRTNSSLESRVSIRKSKSSIASLAFLMWRI